MFQSILKLFYSPIIQGTVLYTVIPIPPFLGGRRMICLEPTKKHFFILLKFKEMQIFLQPSLTFWFGLIGFGYDYFWTRNLFTPNHKLLELFHFQTFFGLQNFEGSHPLMRENRKQAPKIFPKIFFSKILFNFYCSISYGSSSSCYWGYFVGYSVPQDSRLLVVHVINVFSRINKRF